MHPPERSEGSNIATGLFVLTLLAYGYFFGGGGWNQNAIFDLTRAMVERRSFYIDGYHRNTGDAVVSRGHIYANKPPGLSMLAAVPYGVLYFVEKAAGVDPSAPHTLRINVYLCTVLTCGVSGALIPTLLFLYLRRKVSIGWALAIPLLIALGTPLFAYSTLMFVHVPSALLTLATFLGVSSERPRSFAAGLAAGLNALCNFLAFPLLVIFAARLGWRHLWRFAAGAAPALALFAWYQLAAFGSVARNPATMNPAFTTEGAVGGLIRMPSIEALVGVTVSGYRGLFYLSPILILGIGGLVVMFRRRLFADALTIGAVIVLFFGFNSTFNNWNGGSAIGPRYVLPIVPLLGVAMAYLSGMWRLLWIALGILSIANDLAAAAVDPQVQITVPNPLLDYIYPLLLWGRLDPGVPLYPPWLNAMLTGHTSVNRQSVDEILPLIRHAPGSAAAEWASFNLGEPAFGAGSALSLLPLVLVLLAGVGLLILLARAAPAWPRGPLPREAPKRSATEPAEDSSPESLRPE